MTDDEKSRDRGRSAGEILAGRDWLRFGTIEGILIESLPIERLVINLSSMNPGKLERITWFQHLYGQSSTAFLFIKDEPAHFYYDDFDQLMDFIRSLCLKHGIDHGSILVLSSSMGGYAALRIASVLGGVAAHVENPLTSKTAAQAGPPLWLRKMNEVGPTWRDAADLIDAGSPFRLTLVRGIDPADVRACAEVTAAFARRGWPVDERLVEREEHGWFSSAAVTTAMVEDFGVRHDRPAAPEAVSREAGMVARHLRDLIVAAAGKPLGLDADGQPQLGRRAILDLHRECLEAAANRRDGGER